MTKPLYDLKQSQYVFGFILVFASIAVPAFASSSDLNFPESPKEVSDRALAVTAEVDSLISGISNLKADAPAAFDQTFGAFDLAISKVREAQNLFEAVSWIAETKELREAADASYKQMTEWENQAFFNRNVFFKLKNADPSSTGSIEDRRLADHVLQEFVVKGVMLSGEEAARLSEFRKTELDLNIEGQQATTSDAFKVHIDLSSDDVAGSPVTLMDALAPYRVEDKEQDSTGSGGLASEVIFSGVPLHDAVTYKALIGQLANRDARERVYMARAMGYSQITLPILRKVLEVRRNIAALLLKGEAHISPAHLKTGTMSVGSPEFLWEELKRLSSEINPDFQAAIALVQESTGLVELVSPADIRHFLAAQESSSQAAPADALTLDAVIAKYCEDLGKIFGITLTPSRDGSGLFGSELRVIHATDHETGRALGTLFIDPFDRDGKVKNSRQFVLELPRQVGASRQSMVSLFPMNFAKPASGASEPTLSKREITIVGYAFAMFLPEALSDTSRGMTVGMQAIVPIDLTPVLHNVILGIAGPESARLRLDLPPTPSEAITRSNGIMLAAYDLKLHDQTIDPATAYLEAMESYYVALPPRYSVGLVPEIFHVFNNDYAAGGVAAYPLADDRVRKIHETAFKQPGGLESPRVGQALRKLFANTGVIGMPAAIDAYFSELSSP